MEIKNSHLEDLDEIFRLYDLATAYQKEKGVVPWPKFEKSLITKEIKEDRQWKIVINDKIACVWATAFSDPLIWKEKNVDPSIYIHRIATNPEFKGRNLVSEIVSWSRKYAEANRKQYVRMDTVGENSGLISYYEKCGFKFLGLSKLTDTTGLPAHYHNATVSLFEVSL
ncbi:MAG: GNAT family N-acetyltransferase [Bacteroidota bacterium]